MNNENGLDEKYCAMIQKRDKSFRGKEKELLWKWKPLSREQRHFLLLQRGRKYNWKGVTCCPLFFHQIQRKQNKEQRYDSYFLLNTRAKKFHNKMLHLTPKSTLFNKSENFIKRNKIRKGENHHWEVVTRCPLIFHQIQKQKKSQLTSFIKCTWWILNKFR